MQTLRTPWRAVSAMFILNGALFGIWASRIPAVAEIHDLSPGRLGGLLLLLAGGAIVAFPLAGRLADRLGAYRVTWGISYAYVAALILIGLAPNFWSLAVSLFLFGATHGAMDVTMNTWASEVERKLDRPMMSSFHAMFSLGAGLGAGTGVLAASYALGLTAHFVTVLPVITLLALSMAKIGWVSDTSQSTDAAPVFIFPKGPLLAVGFVAFCSSLGEGAMADWSAIFLVLTAEATEAQAALGYSVFSVAMVVMRLLGDRATHLFGPQRTAQTAGVIAATGVLCAVLMGSYLWALFGFALMGVGYAVIVPLAFARAANDPVLAPGAAIASVSTLGYGGLLLGPPVIGFLSELTSLRVAFFLLAILAGLMVLCSGAPRRQS